MLYNFNAKYVKIKDKIDYNPQKTDYSLFVISIMHYIFQFDSYVSLFLYHS